MQQAAANELHTLPTPAAEGLPSIPDLMKVIRKVNLIQMDHHSKMDFDNFFRNRREMNQKMDILEHTLPSKNAAPTGLPVTPPLHRPLPSTY